ncbi:hypothetical protein ACOMSG_09890 [Macellibacteroides fermentans]|uniref:hypothetical protein n=1 Tax=Macellibacteroides fermentans TaxID=879969 RepID=UPI003B95F4A1
MKNLLFLAFTILCISGLKAQSRWIEYDYDHKKYCNDWACMGTYYLSIDFNTLPTSGAQEICYSVPAIGGTAEDGHTPIRIDGVYGPFPSYATSDYVTRLFLRLSQGRVLLELEGLHPTTPIPIEIHTNKQVSMYGIKQYGFYHVMLMISNLPN